MTEEMIPGAIQRQPTKTNWNPMVYIDRPHDFAVGPLEFVAFGRSA